MFNIIKYGNNTNVLRFYKYRIIRMFDIINYGNNETENPPSMKKYNRHLYSTKKSYENITFKLLNFFNFQH